MNPNFVRLKNLILMLAIVKACHSQTNLPDSITSHGNKFSGVYFNFSGSNVVTMDSIVLDVDLLNENGWDGPNELQVILGNDYPDFYFGTFQKAGAHFKLDSLKYVASAKIDLVKSDSNGDFNFKSMKMGYNFQTATPYFMPGIWGRVRFYFSNGASFGSVVFEDRAPFTTGISRSKGKRFVNGHKNLTYNLVGRKSK